MAVGAALLRRGHAVELVANPYYERIIRRAGLEFLPAGAFLDLEAQVERNPHLLEPLKGGATLVDDILSPNTIATYEALKARFETRRPDVLLGNDLSFGAFWAAAERDIPCVLAHATPMMWASRAAPIVTSDWTPPRFVQAGLAVAGRAFIEWFLGRRLRRDARRVRTKVRDPSLRGTKSLIGLQLGLWSPLLRGSVSTDPANGVICGSVRASGFGAPAAGLPPEVEAFLAAGPPPVVVGLGSIYSLITSELLQNIAAACVQSGLRCLIVGHASDAKFPEGVVAVRYAPYDALFPRAAVAVVHGGAGATGDALRSGRPVLAVPFAFDQFWMAAQIVRLGVGERIRVATRSADDFAAVLQRLVSDPALASRAAETARGFVAERDGAEIAADRIEALLASGRPEIAATAA